MPVQDFGTLKEGDRIKLVHSINGISSTRNGVGTVTAVQNVSLSGPSPRAYVRFDAYPDEKWYVAKGDTVELLSRSSRPSDRISFYEGYEGDNLYKPTSAEVIDGVVPQVKYNAVIVWQGEPVSTTDDDGKDLDLVAQHDNAVKVAEKKVHEVVKKQFA